MFYPTAMTQPVTANRFTAFDRLRGLIMVIMAIDHASYFIARVHASEDWSVLPPFYASHAGAAVWVSFITRWITHLCAPGFFMLMGAGMVWLGKSRQQQGWSHARIRNYFITRGLILLVIQQFIENPAWLLSILSAGPSLPMMLPTPGGGSDPMLFMAVISALGVSMIVWAFLIELPSIVVLGLSVLALVASVAMTPAVSAHSTIFPIWRVLLFVPGHSNVLELLYPFVPWLAPAGLGIVLARIVYKQPQKTALLGIGGGIVLLIMFVVMRSASQGDPHSPLPGFVGFMSLTKYPPSPAFFSATLGIDLLLLAVFAMTVATRWLAPLEVFGRSPLFFYLLHLYVFGIASFAFPTGTSFPAMYAVWAVAIVGMYPVCRWYGRFKSSKPSESVWRLL